MLLSRAVALKDSKGLVFAWKPRLPANWETEVVVGVEAALETLAAGFVTEAKHVNHNRGDFPCFSAGISYGGGQTVRRDLLSAARQITLCLGAGSPKNE